MKRLQSVIPPTTYAWLRRMYYVPKRAVLRFVRWSPFLTSVVYLVDPAFRREQAAVASGFLSHHRQSNAEVKFFLLRRNIHRIEKGLVMRPRRSAFALDYIRETVNHFDAALVYGDSFSSWGDLSWAQDVLESYFQAVDSSPVVEAARLDFESAKRDFVANSAPACKRVPYSRQNVSVPSYESFYALARQRRSVRWFSGKPVERKLIDQAVKVAVQSPSACNRQPFVFRVFDDADMVKRLVKLPMGTAGFAHNIPVITIVVGDLSAYFGERDRHGIYVDASLASMSLMLALETVGLSSCPLNWPDVTSREREMSKLLDLKTHERVIMCIAIGYPDPEGLVAYSQKRSLDQARSYNMMH